MKRILKPVLAIALIFSGIYTSFADYQVEGGLALRHSDLGDDIKYDSLFIRGAYYIKPVNDDKGPLAEAAFLDQSSNIFSVYSYSEIDAGGFSIDGDDANAIEFGGNYIDQDSGLILGARYYNVNGPGSEEDFNSFLIAAGAYLTPSSTVIARFLKNDDNDDEFDNDSFNVGYKNLISTTDNKALNVEVNLSYVDRERITNSFDTFDYDEIIFSIGGDYYFNRQASLGARIGFLNADADNDDEDTYNLRAQYFFNNQAAVNLSFNKISYDSDNEDLDVISVGMTGRF